MSETENIPIDEVNISPESENKEFKGILGPLEDEIHIRKFAEKHKNAPLYNGAFKQVKFILVSAELMVSLLKRTIKDTMTGYRNLFLLLLIFL
jgi:hypothetical protein